MGAVLLRDSRRITGPHLVAPRAAAIIDATGDALEEFCAHWEIAAREMLDRLGWSSETTHVRLLRGGASIALTAPIDALYAATEINEWAFANAGGDVGDADVSVAVGQALDSAAEILREVIAAERNPALLALRDAAQEHGVAFLADDDEVSIGLGIGSRTFRPSNIPMPDAVDWDEIFDIPIALVTGTNGKTTTVRLVAAMIRAAGRTPGTTTTDWVQAGEVTLEHGDYSGPGGARLLLRDRRVEMAVLETARGGMLRRGLAVTHADVACVLNVAEDHLGEFGVADLVELAETKLTVARVIDRRGRLVAPRPDAWVEASARATGVPCAWFPASGEVDSEAPWGENEETRVSVEHGRIVLHHLGKATDLGAVEDVPATLGGVALHNVANALAAVLIADGLGIDHEAITGGLQSFATDAASNPGRGNLFELGGVRAIADFAHNPHGLRAVFAMAARLPAERRLVILGQAGDRDDGSIRELTRVAAGAAPDCIVIKEIGAYLRGREPGQVPVMIEDELHRLGFPPERIHRIDTEMAAVRFALKWARPGDLLLLLLHDDRSAVLSLLGQLEADGWRAGEVLPG